MSINKGEIPPSASQMSVTRLLHWRGDRISRGELRLPHQPGRRRCDCRGFGSPGCHCRPTVCRRSDVVVVNTCSVTAEADRDARAYIRRVQRANPTGSHRCHRLLCSAGAQTKLPLYRAYSPLSAIVIRIRSPPSRSAHSIPNRRPTRTESRLSREPKSPDCYGNLAPAFCALGIASHPRQPSARSSSPARPPSSSPATSSRTATFELPSLPCFSHRPAGAKSSAAHRTRPSLKIQDGCGNRCTFCVIPSTRGNSRSLPKQQVLDSVWRFVAAGGQELVISGINLGRWGRDLLPANSVRRSADGNLRDHSASAPAHQLRRADGLDRWADLIALLRRWGNGLASAIRPARSHAVAVWIGPRSAPYAPPLSALALCRTTGEGSRSLPGCSHRRRRHGRLPRRNGGRIS